jgi:hypothetical protein
LQGGVVERGEETHRGSVTQQEGYQRSEISDRKAATSDQEAGED